MFPLILVCINVYVCLCVCLSVNYIKSPTSMGLPTISVQHLYVLLSFRLSLPQNHSTATQEVRMSHV